MASSPEPDKHIFMLCRELNRAAFAGLPEGYCFRSCRREELELWLDMPFDTAAEAAQYRGFMRSFFDRVYGARAELFFERCTFACDAEDRPVATAFTWPTRAGVTTFHWLKVIRSLEGRGLGRAMISHVMQQLEAPAYPVLLHTHPESFRAIKLYADVGFQLLSDPVIGSRNNDLHDCLPTLRSVMPSSAFEKLVITQAPPELLDQLRGEGEPEF